MATSIAAGVLPPPDRSSLSSSERGLSIEVDAMRRTFVEIWERADPSGGQAGQRYSPRDQARNELQLSALVDAATREGQRARQRRAFDRASERRLLEAFRDFACPALGWDRSLLDGPEADEFADALRAFPALARRFDPALTSPELYQAARNAITFHCLQRLLGQPVRPTPSCLAYSLLYPYTDNYLDDTRIDPAVKRGFGERLACRLRGLPVEPATSHERRVFALVGIIEGEHARDSRPEVFASLLAIHAAQQRSLALLHAAAPLPLTTIVEITVDKGGTSVLADGCLAAGSLSARQAECIFGLGVFLQLRDDLEDLAADRAAGQRTVFSSVPDREPLDAPTARTFAIGAAVVERLDVFPSAGARQVRDVIRQSLYQTIIDAAASYAGRYTPAYRLMIDAQSPVRLAGLLRQRRRLSRAQGSLTSVLEAWLDHPEQSAHAV